MDILEKIKNEVQDKMKQNDSAHDFSHIMRVYKNAENLCKKESGNEKLVLCAALLHDIVSYPKNDKRSKNSSKKSASEAKKILKKYSFSTQEIKIICEAIEEHSFSKNKKPQTLEGQILQDADRLDAIGAIGIARTFVVGGAENRPIYNELDPFCEKRKPDDKNWTLDHFFKKLLLIEKKMNTKSAKIESKKRTKTLKTFLKQLDDEI